MAKLEDIPKKEIFSTPENYFDKLPGRIEARISRRQKRMQVDSLLRYSLKYALPIVVIGLVALYYGVVNSGNSDAQTILASVETDELIRYLQESGVTTEELLENVEFTSEELEAIETLVYGASFDELPDFTAE